jgi:type IV secretory pathway TrbD component
MTAGAETSLVMVNLLTTVIFIALSSSSLLSYLVFALIALWVHVFLVKLARHDPQLSSVYLRSRKFRDYYPARAPI